MIKIIFLMIIFTLMTKCKLLLLVIDYIVYITGILPLIINNG